MRSSFLLFLLLLTGLAVKAQIPAPPTTCTGFKGNATCTMSISGPTSFLLDNLSKFSTSEPNSSIVINVKSSKDYKLFIAGKITQMADNPPTNTIIPIGTFTAISDATVGGPPTVTLTEGYQLIAQNVSLNGQALNAGRNHTITITRNVLNTFDQFKQAPGTHTLNLYFYLCQ